MDVTDTHIVSLSDVRAQLRARADEAAPLLRFGPAGPGAAVTQAAMLAAVELLFAARFIEEVEVDGHVRFVAAKELEGLDESKIVDALLDAVIIEVLRRLPAQPEAAPKKDQRRKYPFDSIPVGETFYVEVGPGQPKWESFRANVSKEGRLRGKRFLCHRYPDGRYAVWRQS